MPSKTLPTWVINFFFYTGLVSATLFRIIIFLNRIDLTWARMAWYIGVLGYILFFGYRYYITRKRRAAIRNYDLLLKLAASDMEETAKNELSYILNSLLKSREMVNYIYIFVTSALAVVIDMALVFLG